MSDRQETDGMSLGRLEAFSDGVIAIIITIMVLELKPPALAEPAALLREWHMFAAYALSFVLVAIYWVNHHQLLGHSRRVGPRSLWLNIHWLFWLSLYPFATSYVGQSDGSAFPVALYAAVSMVTGAAFQWLAQDVVAHNADLPGVVEQWRGRVRMAVIAALLNAAAIPLAYIARPVAVLFLAAPAMAYFWPRGTGEAKPA